MSNHFRLAFRTTSDMRCTLQLGEQSIKAKPLHGRGGQVMEIAAYDASGTYRAVYTVSIG